ncbi:hypothetical protein GGQ64_003259 [Rhizobium azooxidifex]|uniref:Uncharacterized protein n=1 Tax=Mycoplana azooxidifex TaxID=1636188 RepID=A0A7W6DC76_9HYPH|nr:hypothetical protein [Mycoplana azooxidifex]MBB3978045.1 hypothetical protein [Mycoplana azooxidifex]
MTVMSRPFFAPWQKFAFPDFPGFSGSFPATASVSVAHSWRKEMAHKMAHKKAARRRAARLHLKALAGLAPLCGLTALRPAHPSQRLLAADRVVLQAAAVTAGLRDLAKWLGTQGNDELIVAGLRAIDHHQLGQKRPLDRDELDIVAHFIPS